MRIVGLGSALGLAMTLAMVPMPSAADPLRLVQKGPLPFDANELSNAVALRAAICPNLDAGPNDLIATVTGKPSGVITLVVADRQTAVTLGAATGAEAARIVAIAIVDLAADRIDPPTVMTPRNALVDALQPPVIGRVQNTPRPMQQKSAQSSREPRAYVAIGAAYQEVVTVRIETGLTVGPLIIAAAAGRNTASFTTSDGNKATFRNYPMQLGLGHRWPITSHGAVEAALVGAVMVRIASAQRSQTNVQFGGGAVLMWSQRIAHLTDATALALRIGGGVAGYRNGFDYQINTTPVTSTPTLSWYGGAMLSLEMTP
jgi:hypothetical protein